jgi:hypothetical protein
MLVSGCLRTGLVFQIFDIRADVEQSRDILSIQEVQERPKLFESLRFDNFLGLVYY